MQTLRNARRNESVHKCWPALCRCSSRIARCARMLAVPLPELLQVCPREHGPQLSARRQTTCNKQRFIIESNSPSKMKLKLLRKSWRWLRCPPCPCGFGGAAKGTRSFGLCSLPPNQTQSLVNLPKICFKIKRMKVLFLHVIMSIHNQNHMSFDKSSDMCCDICLRF